MTRLGLTRHQRSVYNIDMQSEREIDYELLALAAEDKIQAAPTIEERERLYRLADLYWSLASNPKGSE